MARIFIVCFIVIAGIFVSAIANEYCKITCTFDAMVYKHTMCLYPVSATIHEHLRYIVFFGEASLCQ